MLSEFPSTGCVEIHLATEFQRTIFNHPRFPEELRRRQEAWLHTQILHRSAHTLTVPG